MLVLSRRCEESILFPELGIRIQVLQCSKSKVRLGVQAPRNVTVLRSELVADVETVANEQPTTNSDSANTAA